MKRFITTTLSLTLAIVMAFLGIAQVFADSQKTYVGEVKVATGGSAKSDLTNDGFTILCDESGKPVDLNQGAGGGKGSQGDKKVLMKRYMGVQISPFIDTCNNDDAPPTIVIPPRPSDDVDDLPF